MSEGLLDEVQRSDHPFISKGAGASLARTVSVAPHTSTLQDISDVLTKLSVWILVNAQGALALMEDELVAMGYIGTPSASEINKTLFPAECRQRASAKSNVLTKTPPTDLEAATSKSPLIAYDRLSPYEMDSRLQTVLEVAKQERETNITKMRNNNDIVLRIIASDRLSMRINDMDTSRAILRDLEKFGVAGIIEGSYVEWKRGDIMAGIAGEVRHEIIEFCKSRSKLVNDKPIFKFFDGFKGRRLAHGAWGSSPREIVTHRLKFEKEAEGRAVADKLVKMVMSTPAFSVGLGTTGAHMDATCHDLIEKLIHAANINIARSVFRATARNPQASFKTSQATNYFKHLVLPPPLVDENTVQDGNWFDGAAVPTPPAVLAQPTIPAQPTAPAAGSSPPADAIVVTPPTLLPTSPRTPATPLVLDKGKKKATTPVRVGRANVVESDEDVEMTEPAPPPRIKYISNY